MIRSFIRYVLLSVSLLSLTAFSVVFCLALRSIPFYLFLFSIILILDGWFGVALFCDCSKWHCTCTGTSHYLWLLRDECPLPSISRRQSRFCSCVFKAFGNIVDFCRRALAQVMVTWDFKLLWDGQRNSVAFPREAAGPGRKDSGLCSPWAKCWCQGGGWFWYRPLQTLKNVTSPTPTDWSCEELRVLSTCLLLGWSGVLAVIST